MAERPFVWERSYPAGVRWDAPIPTGLIADLLTGAAARFPTKPALEYRGCRISYADLATRVETLASVLLARGLGRGRPLALYLPNTPWHPIAFFAAARIGAPVVHLSPLEAEPSLALKLADSGARTLVTTTLPGLVEMAGQLSARGLLDRVLVGEEADVGGEATTLLLPPPPAILECLGPAMAAASPADWPRIAPGDLALLQYTGGTTGTPRAAMLTHANLTAAIASYDAWSIGQGLARPGEDIVICVLPLFHIYALTSILLRQIHNGSLILLRPRFDADATLADIEAGRATTLPAVPTIWIALASRPDLARRDLSSLRFGGSGGAPLPVEVAARIMSLTGLRIGGGWGMTETSPAGTYVPSTGDVPAGTIGLPLPGVEMGVVALDDPTRELPPGETGELRVRGPNVTAGYWRRPEETAAAFVDGYLLTGDIGHMDTNGFFFLTDRKKDLIISGGFNVYPQMIEQAIYEHPAIEECLVVGVPDAYRGEAAKAFVKVRAGQVAPTLEELRAFLAGRLGRHELPAALEVRASLPRTPVGKLTKTGLREEERRKALASAPSAAPS